MALTSADDHLHVADAIGRLPGGLRAKLAEGPLPHGQCRICDTLRTWFTDDADIIVDYHEVSYDKVIEAATRTLGRDQRMTNEQRDWAEKAVQILGSVPEVNVKTLGMARNAIETLAENLTWSRCLYIYLVAGWKP